MCKGGAEKVISILANEFCNQGHDVEIALLLKYEVDQELYHLNKRIAFVDLSPKKNGYLRNTLFWIRKTRKYLKMRKPEKVVSFIGRINCIVLTASIGLKTEVYVSERNDPKHDGRSRIILWYCNHIYKKAKKVIFQTKYEMSCFSKKIFKKSTILPNPVDVAYAWNQREDGYFKIVNTARLNQQKNHLMLIKAIGKLLSNGYKVKCTIFGEGELRTELETYVKQNGLLDAVSLPGNVANVCSAISEFDLFVQTSNYEGLSNSLIEAMSMGMPCICTHYPGSEELIVDKFNGLLVPIDNYEMLSEKIAYLINNRDVARTIGNNAQKISNVFSTEIVIKKWNKEILENDCELSHL